MHYVRSFLFRTDNLLLRLILVFGRAPHYVKITCIYFTITKIEQTKAKHQNSQQYLDSADFLQIQKSFIVNTYLPTYNKHNY